MRGRHGRDPQDTRALDGDVGDTEMVPKLILAGELLKEPIKIRIP